MISFVNTFLSYLLLMFIIVAVAGVGFFVGMTMRKRKNAAVNVEEAKNQE